MTQWDIDIDFSVGNEIRKTLMRKHYITKEPFEKVTMHEMYYSELLEDVMDMPMKVIINTVDKNIRMEGIEE